MVEDKWIPSGSPVVRVKSSHEIKNELNKSIKGSFHTGAKRMESVSKKLSKTLPKRFRNKKIFKKEKQGTVVYRGSNPNAHFKQEWEQEGKFLSWKS